MNYLSVCSGVEAATVAWHDLGFKRTKAQIAAVCSANRGKKRSDETKRKMSIAQLGEKNHRFRKPVTEEHKQKIIAYQKSKVVSELTKQRMRDAWILRKANST